MRFGGEDQQSSREGLAIKVDFLALLTVKSQVSNQPETSGFEQLHYMISRHPLLHATMPGDPFVEMDPLVLCSSAGRSWKQIMVG